MTNKWLKEFEETSRRAARRRRRGGGFVGGGGIQLVAVAVPASVSNTTSFQITIPAAIAAGHDLLLSALNDGANTAPTVIDNDTGGNTWTNIGGSGLTLWWKKATAGTAGKVITASGFTTACNGGLAAYRGGKAGNPLEGFAEEPHSTGAYLHTGVTSTVNGSMIVLIVGNRQATNAVVTNLSGAILGPLTKQYEHINSGNLGLTTTHASVRQALAGATGDLTWQQTPDGANFSHCVRILPA